MAQERDMFPCSSIHTVQLSFEKGLSSENKRMMNDKKWKINNKYKIFKT